MNKRSHSCRFFRPSQVTGPARLHHFFVCMFVWGVFLLHGFSERPTERRFKPCAFEGRDRKSASSEQFPLGRDPGPLTLKIPGAAGSGLGAPAAPAASSYRPRRLFPTAWELGAAVMRPETRSSHTHREPQEGVGWSQGVGHVPTPFWKKLVLSNIKLEQRRL